mgnify:CR=1 FL=1
MPYKTTRANKMRSRNGQPRSGHCIECGRITSETLGGIRVTIPAQKNGVWLCEAHRGKRNLQSYGDENSNTIGTPTADGFSISIELESMGYSSHARAYLDYNKFIPTYDSTVDIEYKSPIYFSEIPLAKIVGGIEYMDKNDSYKFKVNHHKCGIHTHYGFVDNHFDFRTLENHYKELFKPLCDVVNSLNNTEREAIFGRSFESYNDRCDFYYPDRHINWINIQHKNTLEIRMPRFVNADDYMRFVKCFKKIFKALNTHYISKAHNTRNAEKAGRKMAMVFKKEYKEYFQPVNIENNDNISSNTTTITWDSNEYSLLNNRSLLWQYPFDNFDNNVIVEVAS